MADADLSQAVDVELDSIDVVTVGTLENGDVLEIEPASNSDPDILLIGR